jgi:hypothetical protein
MHNLAHSQHLCLWGHICVYSVSMFKIIWASIVCVGAFSLHFVFPLFNPRYYITLYDWNNNNVLCGMYKLTNN